MHEDSFSENPLKIAREKDVDVSDQSAEQVLDNAWEHTMDKLDIIAGNLQVTDTNWVRQLSTALESHKLEILMGCQSQAEVQAAIEEYVTEFVRLNPEASTLRQAA